MDILYVLPGVGVRMERYSRGLAREGKKKGAGPLAHREPSKVARDLGGVHWNFRWPGGVRIQGFT